MNLEITDYIFLPIILILGIATSWEDYKFKKVRNNWIIIGLIYGIIAFGLLFLWSKFVILSMNFHYPIFDYIKLGGRMSFIIPSEYFGKVLVNSMSSLLVSFFLWKNGLLAAGDAKLFFLFSFLLPLKYYWKSYLLLFPSFSLLTNIFLPIFIFTLLKAIQHNLKSLSNIDFKNSSSLKQTAGECQKKIIVFIKTLFGLILVYIIVSKFLALAGPYLPLFMKSSIFGFLVFIIINRLLAKYFKNKKIYAIAILILIFLLIFDCFKLGVEMALTNLLISLKTSIWYMLIFMSIRYVVENYIQITTRYKINVKELKSTMILGVDKKVMPKIGSITGGGMSLEQVEMVQKWCADNNLNEIEIYKKFPFAVWILAGVIITIILKESLLVLFLNLLKQCFII